MQILKGVVKNPRGPRRAGKKLTLQSSGSEFGRIVAVLIVDSSVVLGLDVVISIVFPFCVWKYQISMNLD